MSGSFQRLDLISFCYVCNFADEQLLWFYYSALKTIFFPRFSFYIYLFSLYLNENEQLKL